MLQLEGRDELIMLGDLNNTLIMRGVAMQELVREMKPEKAARLAGYTA